MCNSEEENGSHLFFTIYSTKTNLVDVCCFFNFSGSHLSGPCSVKDHLASRGVRGMRKSVRKIWNTVPACVCRIICKERSARCFERKIVAIQKIKQTCLWFLAFWCNLQDVNNDNSVLDFTASLHE